MSIRKTSGDPLGTPRKPNIVPVTVSRFGLSQESHVVTYMAWSVKMFIGKERWKVALIYPTRKSMLDNATAHVTCHCNPNPLVIAQYSEVVHWKRKMEHGFE